MLVRHLVSLRLKLSNLSFKLFIFNFFLELVFVKLFIFFLKLVLFNHSFKNFTLGLRYFSTGCFDHVIVFSTDENLVVVHTIYTLLVLIGNEVDG